MRCLLEHVWIDLSGEQAIKDPDLKSQGHSSYSLILALLV